tara:strand:+ start:289 stop:552 length:264 start_codon:yes stop_codon:yes gene_type:complete
MPSFDDLLNQAEQQTNEELATKLSSLTALKDEELKSLMEEDGVEKQNIIKLMSILSDASKDNTEKAKAIDNIAGASKVVIALLKKVL